MATELAPLVLAPDDRVLEIPVLRFTVLPTELLPLRLVNELPLTDTDEFVPLVRELLTAEPEVLRLTALPLLTVPVLRLVTLPRLVLTDDEVPLLTVPVLRPDVTVPCLDVDEEELVA